jgi:site-specific recombinase XerD
MVRDAYPLGSRGGVAAVDDLPGAVYGGFDTVSHLRAHLLWMRRAGRSERTLYMRRSHMVRLCEALGHDPLTATEAELEQWQDSLAATAIRQKTTQVRPYYGWCHAKGYRPDNPAALLVTPRARRGIPNPIDTADLMRALERASPRVLPWLLLAAWSGLRAKEIAELRVEDFYHHEGRTFIRLTQTKGDAPRTGMVPGWVWVTIRPLMAPQGRCWRRERGFGVVTPQHVSQLCNEHLRRLGIHSTLHKLRHWAGTEALEATGNIREVGEFLGHLDLSSTEVYTKVRPLRLHQMVETFPRPNGARTLRAADSA